MTRYRDTREFVHRIDRDDRISFVNGAWLEFAAENGWRKTPNQVLGSPLMPQIAGAETRHIYRLLIERTRASDRTTRFCYRCDSPGFRRFMEMRVGSAGQGQVEFRSRVLRLERRTTPMEVLDAARRDRSVDVLTICSWCKSVLTNGVWWELEDGLRRTGILASIGLPQISHGICPACSERMSRKGERL
jgi:hypothetical protein